LLYEPPAHGVLEIEDVVQRPVEVVGHVRDLLVQAVGVGGHDPPRRSPATSTVNSCLHDGQVTAARVCPSELMRRYRSCRNARSEAKRSSTIPAWTSVIVPRRVMTRASRTTVR